MNLSVFIESIFSYIYQWLTKYYLQLLFSLVAITFLVTLINRFIGISVPLIDIGGIENAIIYGLEVLLDKGYLYEDPSQAPYGVIQYSPLYYYLVWVPAKFLGIEHYQIFEVYQVSRATSLIFNLVFIYLGYRIARRNFKIPTLTAATIAGFTFVILRSQNFSRPDSLYNIFVLLTIMLLLSLTQKSKEERTWQKVVLIGLAVFLSIFSKQSGIVLPFIAGFVMIFIWKDYKSLLYFSISTLGFTALGVLLLHLGGNIGIYENMVMGIQNGFDFPWWWRQIVMVHFFSVEGIIINPIILFGSVKMILDSSDTKKVLGYSIIGLWVFALLTSLKHGSTPSYFTETWILGLISIVLIKDFNYPKVLVLLVCLLFCSKELSVSGIHRSLFASGSLGQVEAFEEAENLKQFFENEPNREQGSFILNFTENFVIDLNIRSLSIFPTKYVVDCCSAPLKTYDYTNYHQQVTENNTYYIVLRKGQNLPLRYVGVEYQSYEKVDTLGNCVIFQLSGKNASLLP